MQFRQYPIIISEQSKIDGTYFAYVPDLQLRIVIRGYKSIADVCGASIAAVHMYCNALKAEGTPLPAASPIKEVQQNRPDGFITCIAANVTQAEDGDII